MRLTAEVIGAAPAYMNPFQERELNLRGLKIPAIENLGVTEDLYAVIDLSDNDVIKLDNLPLLKRLTTLLLNNNRITKIQPGLGKHVPHLVHLILTNNRLQSFADLDPLADLSSLQHLSLLHNPIAKYPHYRLYVVHLLPHLRTLDFQKVKDTERRAAVAMFGASPAAAAAAKSSSSSSSTVANNNSTTATTATHASSNGSAPFAAASRTFVVGGGDSLELTEAERAAELAARQEKKKQIMSAIQNASSLAEMAEYEKQLKQLERSSS